MATIDSTGDTKNTIAGFDSVISISQEAINKQLEVLYKTPVKNPKENGPRFLIDHEMHFHRLLEADEGGLVPSEDGLDAYVSCPTIDFSGDKLRDKNEKMTTARISFTFRSSSQLDGPGPSGVESIYMFMNQKVINRRSVTLYEPKNVTGWTMSWEGKVGQKDIANTLHEIVGSDYVTNSTKEKLEKVDTKVFSVASIFCLFESHKIARTFTLVDDKGVDKSNESWKLAFLTLLNSTFAGNDQGSTTPTNPFVLGYTITQKKPSLQQVNTSSNMAPAYFQPRTFYCMLSNTVEPFCKGTLNYLVLTQRTGGDPFRNTDPFAPGQESAGRIHENLFSKLKMKARPGSADGVLGFSQDIFLNYWIRKEVLPRFRASYEPIRQGLAGPTGQSSAFQLESSQVRELVAPFNCWSQETFESKPWKKEELGFAGQVAIKITHQVDVRYTSTLGVDPSLASDPDDTKRRLILNIRASTYIEVACAVLAGEWTNIFSPLGFDAGKHKIPAGRIKSLANCRWKLELGADPSNRGNFAVMNVVADHMENGVLKTTDSNPPNTEMSETMTFANTPSGMFVSFSVSDNKALDSFLEQLDMVKELKAVGKRFAVGASEDLKKAVTGLADSLSTTVIMPAGDIFMFKGLNTDPQGNVYSGITYSTPSGGEVSTHGGIEKKEGLTTRSFNRE